MKKYVAIAAALFASLVVSQEGKAITPYISGGIGGASFNGADVYSQNYVIPYATLDTGINLQGALGIKIQDVRLETELSYQRNDLRYFIGHIAVTSVMANIYYDALARFPVYGSPLRPYIMGGLGMARVTSKDIQTGYPLDLLPYGTQETKFAYQIGAGIAFPIGAGLKLDTGFRYFATSTLKSVLDHDAISSSNFALTLRYGF